MLHVPAAARFAAQGAPADVCAVTRNRVRLSRFPMLRLDWLQNFVATSMYAVAADTRQVAEGHIIPCMLLKSNGTGCFNRWRA